MSGHAMPSGSETLLAHGDFVRGLARSLLFDADLAEDVAQQAFLAALERPPRARSLRAWLGGVVRNLAWKALRARSRRAAREAAVARGEATVSTAQVVEREATRRRVVEAVLGLEEPYRSTVLLRFYEDLPPRDIAARQGVPVETVKTRLKRGLERLRARMDDTHGGDRRAWGVALLPLAGGPVPGGGGGALEEVLAMGARMRIAAAAVVLLAGGWFAWGLLPERAATPVQGRPADRDAGSVASAGIPIAVSDAPRPRPAATVPPSGRMPAPPPAPVGPPRRGEAEASPATATVVVRVTDRPEGKPVSGFRCSFRVEGGAYTTARADGPVLAQVVALPVGSTGVPIRVRLLEPPVSGEVERILTLAPGARVEVEFVRSCPEVAGFVDDAQGLPVAGALVYVGDQVRARGDEPFKPFDERRIADGVRTDADGRFAIRGEGRWLTVWHADHSPVTVPIADAGRVRLPPRARLRVRVVGPEGLPVPGVGVALDLTRRATTEANGECAFDRVEAGLRGLTLPPRRLVGVRLAPGEEAEVEIPDGLAESRIAVVAAGRPFERSLGGVLVGLDRVASVHEVRVAGTIAVPHVLPGRFLLLTVDGTVAPLEIRSVDATVDLGAADLAVRAPPDARPYLVPEGADDFVCLLAARLAGGRRAAPDGVTRFAPLPVGRYAIGTPAGGLQAVVDVTGPGATARLE